MKVYVVVFAGPWRAEVLGVFRSKHAAEGYVKKMGWFDRLLVDIQKVEMEAE